MADVISRDGTRISFERSGSGPAVILVDGAMGYSALGFGQRLATLLQPRCTVVAYDRRGRGGSGDAAQAAVDREIDDIDALIGAAGGSAGLYGISSGAALALEAGLRLGPERVTRLALYEPPYDDSAEGQAAWHEYTRTLKHLIAEDRRGDAVALFMSFVGAPEEQVTGARRSPMWPAMEAVAPTLAYDAAVLGKDRTVPVARAAGLRVPALVMNGGASAPFMRGSAITLTGALPQGQYLELAGQRHDVDADVIAPVLGDYFTTGRVGERAA